MNIYYTKNKQTNHSKENCLIKEAISQELNTSPKNIQISRNSTGKPFLRHHNIHFNLSHSENLSVLATDNQELGIDIEKIRPIDEISSLMEEFSLFEQNAAKNLSTQKLLRYFFCLWCAKESYLKAIGKGLTVPLNSFDISINDNKATLVKSIDNDLNWHFKFYNLRSDYICVVCSRKFNFLGTPIQILFSN